MIKQESSINSQLNPITLSLHEARIANSIELLVIKAEHALIQDSARRQKYLFALQGILNRLDPSSLGKILFAINGNLAERDLAVFQANTGDVWLCHRDNQYMPFCAETLLKVSKDSDLGRRAC